MLQIQSWRMHARDDLWHVREFRLRTDCDRRPIVAVRQAAWGTPLLTLNECGSRKSRRVKDNLVGAVGIEPTTFGLKGRCSTTELRPYG